MAALTSVRLELSSRGSCKTYMLVAQYENLHVLLALAATHNYNIKIMDIKGAFFHANLLKEVYVKQPRGFKDHE
jgi:hypothetical protein